jgi:thiamine biosynthesis protein ThiI
MNSERSEKYSTILIHYSEIALKGKNRIYFEEKLINNIIQSFKENGILAKAERLFGRILIHTEDLKISLNILKNIFGIAFFAEVEVAEKSIEKSIATILKNKKYETFAVRARTSLSNSSLSSNQMEIEYGNYIRAKLNKKVDLTNPDLTIYIEAIDNKKFAIYTQKNPGLRGLPTGSSGKALALLSGGIDSPVASYKAISRGLSVDYIHFHSYPQTNKQSLEKVKQLATILKKYHPQQNALYFVPILEAQKDFLNSTDNKYLVLLYRRLMLKIAQELAYKLNSQALITGDSLGQVASQTIENIAVQNSAVEIPILRPLITQDKEDIIKLAKKIGTYELSIQPHQDCCSLFVPKHPTTKAKIEDIIKQETEIDLNNHLKKALEKMEAIKL